MTRLFKDKAKYKAHLFSSILHSELIQFYSDKNNRKKFDKWYFSKFSEHYDWREQSEKAV